MSKLAQWTGTVWQVKGLDGSDQVEVMVKGSGQVAFYNCSLEDVPGYGEEITVTFSQGKADG